MQSPFAEDMWQNQECMPREVQSPWEACRVKNVYFLNHDAAEGV